MTIASVLLALLTATASPDTKSTGAVLLDFHAEWCGPCRTMRPAVDQLIRKGYPVKAIDIDQEPELRQRYHVESVPTFIVVDRAGHELDRTSGAQPVAELARFYKAAAAKARPPANSNSHVGDRDNDRGAGDDEDDQPPPKAKSRRTSDDNHQDDDGTPAETAFANPKPWETVVRIRVINNRSIGFGSGTIIHSTPEESLILTCAHIFKMEGRQKQVPPSQFPRKIQVDLFDGDLQGTKTKTVHFKEAVEGWAVDYDFTRDVGLIRIRPGRRLPACRVVPNHWEPQARMQVLTVGCSEGHDATAWHTQITKPRIQNFLGGNPTYEAIECEYAPKQGRSGGGLFTDDGYIAGICNFAEPMGNHGLYATPRSIYYLLDRNNLMALYAPVSRGSGTLVADNRAGGKQRRNDSVSVARSQSPDHEEPDQNRGRADSDVTVPHPSLLGIAEPIAEPIATRQAKSSPQAASTTRRTAWQPHPLDGPVGTPMARLGPPTEATDLNLDPSAADNDRFGPQAADARTGDADADHADALDGSKASTLVGSGPGSRWRPVKAAPASQAVVRE